MGNDNKSPEESNEEKPEAPDTKETLVSPRSGRTIKKMRNDAENGLLMPPSPPTFVTMQQLTEAANAFYNMSLAHEITVDSHFKLHMYSPPEQSLEHCVKETMHRAFWDILRSSLNADPPDYEPAIRLLGEVKQSLSGLILPNQKTLEKLLDNALDLDTVREQLQDTGSVRLETYAGQVIGIMKQFCAPVRDREVAALESITDPVEAFQQVFVLLEKMHMDLANFTIMQMRPYIRQQAAEYERSQFATFLDAQQKVGIDGLARTRQWIQDAYQRIIGDQQTEPSASGVNQDKSGTAPAQTSTPTKTSSPSEETIQATPSNILLEAYLSLLTWPGNKDWPETMVMDQQRLTEIGLQLSKIVTLTSLVLVVCNCVVHKAGLLFPTPVGHSVQTQVLTDLKRCVFQGASALLDSASLGNLPETAETVADHLLSVVEHWYNSVHPVCQNQSSNSQTSEKEGTTSSKPPIVLPHLVHCEIESQVISIFKSKHPVYCLMHQRAMKFLRSVLSSRPPESLSLPPGFGILTEMTKPTSAGGSGGASPSHLPAMAAGIRRFCDPPRRSTDGSSTEEEEKDSSDDRSSLSNVRLSLTDVAGRLMPLLAHNRHVFGAKYAEIIQAILMPDLASTSGRVDRPEENHRDECNNAAADGDEEPESTFEMSA